MIFLLRSFAILKRQLTKLNLKRVRVYRNESLSFSLSLSLSLSASRYKTIFDRVMNCDGIWKPNVAADKSHRWTTKKTWEERNRAFLSNGPFNFWSRPFLSTWFVTNRCSLYRRPYREITSTATYILNTGTTTMIHPWREIHYSDILIQFLDPLLLGCGFLWNI